MASARYETLYELADKECESARSEICKRMLSWTGIDPRYANRTQSPLPSRLVRKESEWLSDTVAVQEIIRQFNRDTGLTNQQSLGIRGWECGMCQMVDLTKSSVCKVLPFILCAYLYNFPFNKFVQCYLKDVGIGCAREKFFSGIEKDERIENRESVKIGKLLRGEVVNLARMCKDIFRLMDWFQFPEIIACEMFGYMLNYFEERPTYLLPSNLAGKFKRNIHTLIMDTSEGPLEREAPPSGYERYEKWTIYGLFFGMYVSISNCADKWPDYFAAKPDPVMCWILITSALQDIGGKEWIKSEAATLPQDDLLKVVDERILELHDFLKPLPRVDQNGEVITKRAMRKLVGKPGKNI